MKKQICPCVIGLVLILSSLAACNSLFYQPSQIIYTNPKSHNAYHEKMILRDHSSAHSPKLHAWFFPALLRDKKDITRYTRHPRPKGTVIQFHGNAQNMTSHFYSLEWITRHGYNLFAFDYRGYGQSQGQPERNGVRRDAVAAIQYVRAMSGQKRGAKLILYGQSLGGIVLMESLLQIKKENPSLYGSITHIILDSTFSSYQAMAKKVTKSHFLLWPFVPFSSCLVSDAGSPRGKLHNLTNVPKLVIHGTDDQVVPSRLGKKVYKNLPQPKQLWLIQGGKHINIFFMTRYRYRDKFIRYLEQ